MAIINIIIPDLTGRAGHLILLASVRYIQVLSALICAAVNEQSVVLMSC